MNPTTQPPVERSSAKAGQRSLADLLAFVDAMQQRPAGTQGAPRATGSRQAAVDLMALLARCLGNIDLIVRVLTRFKNTGSDDLKHLGLAIERCDLGAVVEISHRLKGAASNVSAAGLQRIAATLEQLWRAGKLAELPAAMAELRREWSEFERYADAFAPALGAAAQCPVGPSL